MRLFKENKIYAYAFCVYALNALFLLQHSIRKSTPIHKLPALSVLVLQCICMLLIAVIAFAAIRRTSNAVEKTALGADRHYLPVIPPQCHFTARF